MVGIAVEKLVEVVIVVGIVNVIVGISRVATWILVGTLV